MKLKMHLLLLMLFYLQLVCISGKNIRRRIKRVSENVTFTHINKTFHLESPLENASNIYIVKDEDKDKKKDEDEDEDEDKDEDEDEDDNNYVIKAFSKKNEENDRFKNELEINNKIKDELKNAKELKYFGTYIDQASDSDYHYLLFEYYPIYFEDAVHLLANNLKFDTGGNYRTVEISPDKAREGKFKLMLELVQAVKHLNKMIFHLDLKPANIRLKKNDELILIDFGISKLKSDKNVMKLGTPYYSAPEQTSDDLIKRNKSDAFSVGAILFYILTGREYFKIDYNKSQSSLFNAMGKEVENVQELYKDQKQLFGERFWRKTINQDPKIRKTLKKIKKKITKAIKLNSQETLTNCIACFLGFKKRNKP